MHQKIAAMRMMFSMWLDEDVQVNRATKLTEAEKGVLSKCALSGQKAAGKRNEHLLFECTDDRVAMVEPVEVRRGSRQGGRALAVRVHGRQGGGGSCSCGEEGEQGGEARASEGSNHGALEVGQQWQAAKYTV